LGKTDFGEIECLGSGNYKVGTRFVTGNKMGVDSPHNLCLKERIFMERAKFSLFILMVVFLSFSLNAQVNYFYSKDNKITFNLRKDLLFIETTGNLKANIKRDFAKSVTADAENFIIMEIDTLKTNIEKITKYSEDINIANVLEYTADGTLQIPTHAIFVCPKPNVSTKKALDEIKKNGIEVVSNRALYDGSSILVVELKMKLNNILEAVNGLSKNLNFEFVEPCFTRLVKYTNPDFGSQWGLQNTGQNGGTPGIDIRAVNAWNYSLGIGVKVAVLGDGVQLDHPDLADNILVNLGYDATVGANVHPTGSEKPIGPPGSPQKNDTHETSCAGIVAAVDNNIGVKGVAHRAKIVPVRIGYGMTPGNVNWYASDSSIVWGIRYARKNADVLNCSWWHGTPSESITREIDSALIKGRNGKGCVVVFIAGNNNASSVAYPASSRPGVIVVGAITSSGVRKSCNSCSNDWGSNYGDLLDVVAPGVNIPTTAINSEYNLNFGGTSAATPHVSGVAALILSINPNLTRVQVSDIIESTARKIGPYTYSSGRPNGTWNNEMGYGLVDAYAAVQAACATLPSVVNFTNQTVNATTNVNSCGNINIQNTTVTSTGALNVRAGGTITINPPFNAAAGSLLKIENLK
jgi:subtilisin family serine protease